jgi:hypothetical protein
MTAFNTDSIEKNWEIVPDNRYLPMFYREESTEYAVLSYLSQRKALVLPEFWIQTFTGENDIGTMTNPIEAVKIDLFVLRYPDKKKEFNKVSVGCYVESFKIPTECYLMVMEFDDNEHIKAIKKHYRIGKRKSKEGKHFVLVALKWRNIGGNNM